MSINLSTVVSKQIPEFIRSDYPLFVEFIQAYYEYLNQYESRNLTELRDVDQTLDSFIQYFKRELDVLGDNYEYIDERLFLRKAKQLFVAKGTETAYKFLFKILYNKPAEISYPWDSVLKASDGKWNQEMSIFVDMTSGSGEDFISNRIDIIASNASIKVFVVRVKYVRDNIYEVFIDKNYYGTILTGYTVRFGSTQGTIIPTTVKATIVRPGEGFRVGELIEGITVSAGITISQLLKVTRVNSTGGILSVAIIRFGAGYQSDFFLLKSKLAINTSGSTITIDKELTRQYSIPDDTYVPSYEEYGYVLTPNYYVDFFGESTYVGTVIRQFYEETNIGENETTNFALIKFDIGAVAKYQGHYTTNDGFLDDDIFLQDSRYYQKYSYLVTVDEKLEKYKALVKAYIHPAGTALFGEYQIQNTFAAALQGTIDLGEWRSSATFTTINTIIGKNTIAYPSDAGGNIRIDPYDENYAELDQHYGSPVTYTFYGDGRNVLSDSTTVSDSSPTITGP
jgi:hypothetical protein